MLATPQVQRRRQRFLAAMIGVTALSALSFLFVMVIAIPSEASGGLRTQDWLVFGGLCALGVGYVAWSAVSNHSLVVGLLGSAEVLAMPAVAWLALRATGLSRTGTGVVVGLVLAGAFLWPWMKVDEIRLDVWRKTGLR